MKKYNEEFKKIAVQLVDELGLRRAHEETKVSDPTLRKWVAEATRFRVEKKVANKRRRFSEEFKTNAVNLCKESGVKATSAKLGVGENVLYRWKKEATRKAPVAVVDENRRIVALQMENARLKEDAESLKRAFGLLFMDYGRVPSGTHEIKEEGPVHTCRNCGEKYIARVPYQKYCSKTCRNSYHYSMYYKSTSRPVYSPSM